jgi:hypothetical protein
MTCCWSDRSNTTSQGKADILLNGFEKSTMGNGGGGAGLDNFDVNTCASFIMDYNDPSADTVSFQVNAVRFDRGFLSCTAVK